MHLMQAVGNGKGNLRSTGIITHIGRNISLLICFFFSALHYYDFITLDNCTENRPHLVRTVINVIHRVSQNCTFSFRLIVEIVRKKIVDV